MKKYTIIVNGKTIPKNVSPEKEQEFLAQYKNNSPTLISDESGKQNSSDNSANGTVSKNALKYEKISKENMESNSEDASSDLSFDDAQSMLLGSSAPDADKDDPFSYLKKPEGNVTQNAKYSDFLKLDSDEAIKQLNENPNYPDLKIEKKHGFGQILELTLPDGSKLDIATGSLPPAVLKDSPREQSFNEIKAASTNALNQLDEFYKENKNVPGSIAGTIIDDDVDMSLSWDRVFKKKDRNEYTSVSEMNEMLQHGGYRIETGGMFSDGKVRLYKTGEDGVESVVLEEDLVEGSLDPVRQYLFNNMTEDEANKIKSVASIMTEDVLNKAKQNVIDKYGGIVKEDGTIDYTDPEFSNDKITSDLINTPISDTRSYVTRSIELALNDNYGIDEDGEVVDKGGTPMSQEGRDLVNNYLNEPIIETQTEYVQYGKEGKLDKIEVEKEVDGWRKTKYDNVLNELKDELTPEDYSILEKVINDKVGVNQSIINERKSNLANEYTSGYVTSLNAQATDVQEIAFKIAVDQTNKEIEGEFAVNDAKIQNVKKDMDVKLEAHNNRMESEVFNVAKKHNLGIEYVGSGTEGSWVIDSSNYIDPSLEKKGKRILKYQEDLKLIDDKIKNGDYENKLNKLNEQAKLIQSKTYTTQAGADAANLKLSQISKEYETIQTEWQSNVDDYNTTLGLHNELLEDYETSSKDKGEKLEKELTEKLNSIWGNVKSLTNEYDKGITDLQRERHSISKRAEENGLLSDVINREEDYGKLLSADFGNAVEGIIYGVPAMFGHKESIDYLNLMNQGSQAGLEKYMSVSEARAVSKSVDDNLSRMQWRRTGRMFAQQTPMIIGAIGFSMTPLGPVGGMAAYSVLTGIQTGGNTKAQLYNLVDMKDDAQAQLTKLEAVKDKMDPEDYRRQKMQLESTVAMGDLTPMDINKAATATAVIEGGVMMAFSMVGGGTLGNSKKFIDDFLKTKPQTWITQASRTQWNIMAKSARDFVGRTGSEVAEESIIYLSSEAAQAGILHREADFSMIGDVILDSMMLGGGMNISPILYTATTSSMVSSEMKNLLTDYNTDLDRVKESLSNLKPGENKRRAQLQKELRTLTEKIGFLQTGLEVDVLLAGKDGIKTILENSVNLTNLYADANVHWGDSQSTIDQKIEDHIKTLKPNEAKDFRLRLEDAQNTINDIKDSSRLKLEGDPESIVKDLYGNKGWDIFKNMLGKDPSFADLDMRDQLSLIHQNIQKNFNANIQREAKSSPVIKYHVENAIYGKQFQQWIDNKLYGGLKIAEEKTPEDIEKENKLRDEVYAGIGIFETLKKDGLIKNRKTTLENQMYESNAKWINSQRVSAAQTYIDSQKSLNEVIKANGGIDAIRNREVMAGKDISEISDMLDTLPDYYFEQKGKTIQEVKKEMLDSFKDGTSKGIIFDGKYIVIGEKDAIQKELNSIESIMSINQSHMLMGTVFLHEFSHALDGITMREGELSQFAENLGKSLRGDINLNQVHEAAVVRLQNLNTPAKWVAGVKLEDQSRDTKDEYIKSVQEIIQNPNNRDLRRAAEAKGKKGFGLGRLRNMVNGLVAGKIPSLGEFNFDSKNTALQYMVSHINSFEKGKLSGFTKGKIAARGVEAKKLKTKIAKLEDELNRVGAKKFSAEKTNELNNAKERLNKISGAVEGDVKRSQDINKRRTEKRKLDQFVQNPDGSPRFENDSEFKNHRNGDTFGRAGLEIKGVDISPDGKLITRDFKDPLSLDLLDREIMKGMTARGIPSGAPMAEFIRRVRSRLSDKFISEYNYDAIKPIVSEVEGMVFYKRNNKGDVIAIEIEDIEGKTTTYKLPKTKDAIVAEGTEIQKGTPLTEGASIFGWMYGAGIIEFAKGDIANKYLKDLDVGSRGAVDIEARTEEGAPRIQIDAGVNLDTDLDNALRTEKEAEQILLMKEELGFDDKFKDEIKRVATEIAPKIGTFPDFNDPSFLVEIEKYAVSKLTDKVKKELGTRNKHVDFLKNNRVAFVNLMPVRRLVSMEREQDVKILAKLDKRLETVDDIQNAIEEGIIPPDSKNKEKVDTYNKIIQQPVVNEDGSRNIEGEKQETAFLKFFFPPTKTPQGNKDNSRGERKTSMSTELAKVIVKQELDLLLDDADFKNTVNEKLKALDRNEIENSIGKIKEAIQTNPRYKHSMDVKHVEKLANFIKADGLQNVINNGKLNKGYEIDGISQTSINIAQYLFEKGDINNDTSKGFIKAMLESNVPEDVKAEFLSQKTLHRDSEFLRFFADDMLILMDDLQLNIPQQKGLRFDMFGFTSTYMNPGFDTKYDVSYNAEYQGMLNLLGDVETNIPGVDISSISIMNKNADGIFKDVIKIQESDLSVKQKIEKLEKLKPKIQAANRSNINLFKHVIKRVRHLVKTKQISPVSAINFLQIQTNIVMGLRGLSKLDLMYLTDGSQAAYVNKKGEPTNSKFRTENKKRIENDINPKLLPLVKEATAFYAKKNPKLTKEQARTKAIENLTWKGEHLGPSANTLVDMLDLIFNNWISDKQMDFKMDELLDGHSQLIAPKYITDLIDEGGRNNTTNFHRVKFLDKVHIDNIYDTEGRGYSDFMLSRINQEQKNLLGSVQDQSVKNDNLQRAFDNASNMIKVLQADLEKRGYTFIEKDVVKFSKDVSRGMSTFDFDETLIIDGKNFVIATNPKTGKQIKVSSGKWPIDGPKLAKQGYEFNFDDFVNVRGGVKGPLFQKLLNRIKKFGPENNFVLTARPQESAVAIHGWLKSKGVNIPFQNITGLGNSTGEAKAQWMIDKFAEGYNDMYFVDDALPNVKAVKSVMEQLDIKGSSVQAKIKFSQDMSSELNSMIERTKGIGAERIYSYQEAKKFGKEKVNFDFIVPPSAEDFKGLLYRFLGKGKQGDADLKFFKQTLLDPYARGMRAYDTYKQAMSTDYENLLKKFPDIKKKLNKKIPGYEWTLDTAVRMYLYDKSGFDIPGIDENLKRDLINHVASNSQIKTFADSLSIITKVEDGYVEPTDNWMVQTISSDLNDIVKNVGRKKFLQEWLDNKNTIFSDQNMNKIRATYGVDFYDALKDMLYRMENGSNRYKGRNKIVNGLLDWINGSVGATMFVNIRSATLQTISMVNFLNFENNNIFRAAQAFANQPQYWKDFATIFNSDMLKQRRAGLAIDVSASELTKVFAEGGTTHIQKMRSIIRYMLEKGFTPTRMADSFAIAAGGSTYYRNQIKAYTKQGMSKAEAEKQAFLDFQEIAEETQQSSRPDLISMQQAGVMGRLILAWQNTPMQMTRLTKKAVSDLVNRRGDWKSNVSRIIYYGVVQNIIFGTLQTGLGFMMFGKDEDEERKKKLEQRVLNGALDSLLRGTGVYGAMVSTIKNTILEYQAQEEKGSWRADHVYTILQAISLSPPIGSKLRKLYAARQTDVFNKGVGDKLGWRIENPRWSIAGNLIEGLTNVPVARLVHKANNVEEALTSNHEIWQRVALLAGWSQWSVGVKDEELEAAKQEVKDEKEQKKKIEKQKKEEEKKKQKEEEKKQVEKEKKEKGIKKVRCSAIRSNGQRCNMMVETKNKTAKCMYHRELTDKEKKEGTDRDNDGIKEFRCIANKKNGERCKNRTENKNKKCYAHQ